MADPTPYSRGFSFTDYQEATPQDPLPGPNVDVELDEIAGVVTGLVDAVKDVRRSDGALKNGIVTADSLAAGLQIELTATSTAEAIAAAADAQTQRVLAEAAADAAEGDATAANTSLTALQGIWLGARTSNPTGTIPTGAEYFNTTANERRLWNGSAWVSSAGAAGATGPAGAAAPSMIVASVAALRGVSKTAYTHVATAGYYANGDGGGGIYYLHAADTTTADNGGSVIVAADGGRWKYAFPRDMNVLQWGAKGDNSTNDQPTIQAALSWAQSFLPGNGEPGGRVYAPPGYSFRITSGLVINDPITFDFRSWLEYTPTTGAALTIGTGAPVRGYTYGFDVYIQGIRAVNGNGTEPTNYNTVGNTGVRINNMSFCRMFEVQNIVGFTNAGMYLDGVTGSAGIGTNQVIIHNKFRLGNISRNGFGLLMYSTDPATSCVEANDFDIVDIWNNFWNIAIDSSTVGASTSNTFRIQSMDTNATGGKGIVCYGSFNRFEIDYTGCQIQMLAGSSHPGAMRNSIRVQNPQETDSKFDIVEGLLNSYTTGPTNALPASGAITAGTVYKNTYGVPLMVYISANVTVTSGSSEGAFADVGPTNAVASRVASVGVNPEATPVTKTFPFSFRVPAGYYYRFSASGSGSVTWSNVVLTNANL